MQVSFRKIELEDLELIREWRNQERIRKNSRDHRMFSREDQLNWFQRISDSKTERMFLVLEDNTPAGLCGLVRINWQDRSAEISYYLGRQKNAVVDVAVGLEAYTFLKKRGFEECGLVRLYGEAFRFNEGGLKLACHCGFKKEGVKKESIFWNEKYWDGFIVSMSVEEYEKERYEGSHNCSS